MIKEIYDKILSCLPDSPDDNIHGFWYNKYDDEIMCESEESANEIADFFEALGMDVMHVHFYRLEEETGNEDCLGWWSVYVDGQ